MLSCVSTAACCPEFKPSTFMILCCAFPLDPQGCSGAIQDLYLYLSNISSSFSFICSVLMVSGTAPSTDACTLHLIAVLWMGAVVQWSDGLP